MMQALVVVFVGLVVAGAVLKGASWARRRAALSGIEADAILKERRGVSMRVLVQGTRLLPGMSRKNANRTVGDLVLLADRFVLTSGKGTIADLREDRGHRFSSVRCTGPGRLVIEGKVPQSDGKTGLYRVEMVLEDANAWAEALKPWVSEGSEFTSMA